MSGQKKPVFGILSLTLMLGLIVAAVLITIYGPPPIPARNGESLAVAVEAAANIIATIAAITTVSLTSIILAGISFLRRERKWPAAVALCLSLSALIVVVSTVSQL